MSKRPKLFHQAFAYYRNYGSRATLIRIRDELILRLKPRRESEPYRHRFDLEQFSAYLQNPDIRVVVFDIFDTLITRPLIDPESTKRWVARRLGRPDYPVRRQKAEAELRAFSPRDVCLAAICSEYVRLYGEEDGDAVTLQAVEEAVELSLATPRADYAQLPGIARSAGKRVVLASDMFLSELHLCRILEQCGISDFDALYVSSQVGARKSSGEMYHHILRQQQVLPQQTLMVGDHEISDQKIPSGLGFHVMGLESVRCLMEQSPRFAPWLSQGLKGEVSTESWIGLIAQRFFGPLGTGMPLDRAALTQGGRKNIGYAITGPLLVAFSEWLADQVVANQLDRLYFLSREGQLMQAVYDLLYADQKTPSTHYLVLSRRAITVPMLKTREDIYEVARATYLPNTVVEFIYRRYGLLIDYDRLSELESIWPKGKKVAISGGRIDHLIPLLDVLSEEILALARQEERAVRGYLEDSGLNEPGSIAVVDVGYSGSIQARLCEMLGRPVDGYYMVTRPSAQKVRDRFGVKLRSCFGVEQEEGQSPSPTLRYNVPLEMLMGSDDPQIRCYRQDGEEIVGEFNELSSDEIASNPMRQELREGALDFVRDYRALRNAGLSLKIEPELAEALFTDFWEGVAESERQAIYNIATDDHYCGMGIVHFATFLPP